jgi:hypothetical protein
MHKQTKTTVSLAVMAGVLSGCITNPSTYVDPAIQAQAPQLIIASEPVGAGYYALVEKQANGHWQVVSLHNKRFYGRDNDQQEVLFVNRGLRSIAPSFDPRMESGEGADCTPLAQLRERKLYGLCKSYFSSIRIGMTVGGNIVSCALTFCLAAGIKVELDRDKIQEVVIDSNLIGAVKGHIAKVERDNYTTASIKVMASRDIDEIERFIGRYRNNDPQNFVPLARDWAELLKRQQAMIDGLAK